MANVPPVVGLRREREVLTVALATGRHVVIEGPPGTGKSTLLRSIARDAVQHVVFVEGNAELTPARLVGQFDPSQVLAEGYQAASFVDGPLLSAMRGGALLYLEELNRVPEETLNVLITVLTEGEIAVPRLGTVHAGKDFRLIAAMNPFDAVGTARVSQAIADRICRIVLGYQDEPAERAITSSVSGVAGRWVDLAVALTRATRSTVTCGWARRCAGRSTCRSCSPGSRSCAARPTPASETARDAAYAALSGRIRMADGVDRTAESVIDELLDRLLAGRLRRSPGTGRRRGPREKVTACRTRRQASNRASARGASGGPHPRPQQLAAAHPAFAEVSPEIGRARPRGVRRGARQDPEAAAALLADLAVATDAQLRAAARRLAGRVFLQLGRVGPARRRGARDGSGLRGAWTATSTSTARSTAGSPAGRGGRRRRTSSPGRWTAHRRAVCLLVDISGSMHGLAVALAAVAAAGVVVANEEGTAGRLEPSVVAFGAEVRVLQPQGVRRPPEDLLSDLVALRGHGITDLAAGLREASTPARRRGGRRAAGRAALRLPAHRRRRPRRGAGWHRPAARARAAGRRGGGGRGVLAGRAGGGRAQTVRRLADVAPALTRILA